MQSAIPTVKIHRTIRPPSGVASLNLSEIWEFRDLLLTLAQRDVRLRYRQTALGVLWVVLQPLIAAGIFTVIFNRVAGLRGDGTPYFLFTFVGQIAWLAYSSTLGKAAASLVGNSALVSKVFFPRLVLPLSTVFSTFVDFAVGLGVVAVLMLIYGQAPFWGVVTLPVWFLLIITLSLGIGLLCAAIMVKYRDVAYIVPVALQFLMFASPIFFSLREISAQIGEQWTGVYLLVNPLASLIEAFRWSLFGRGDVNWGFVGYSAVMAFVMLALGAILFRQQERQFADVI